MILLGKALNPSKTEKDGMDGRMRTDSLQLQKLFLNIFKPEVPGAE